jgi:DNA-binding transcriptional regulator YdaS (Cro superfamily)
LERWRLSAGIETKAAAAALLGMLPQQYCDIVAGRTEPSAARMRQIIEASNGLISADDLVSWKAAS